VSIVDPAGDFRQQRFTCQLFNVFIFRIVDVHLDLGNDVQNVIDQRLQQFPDAAPDALDRDPGTGIARGGDHIIHGFCLSQVNAAGQKRLPGEFTGFGKHRPF